MIYSIESWMTGSDSGVLRESLWVIILKEEQCPVLLRDPCLEHRHHQQTPIKDCKRVILTLCLLNSLFSLKEEEMEFSAVALSLAGNSYPIVYKKLMLPWNPSRSRGLNP